jgi:hypothetical protein
VYRDGPRPRLRAKRQREAQMTLDGLKEWEDLVRDYVAEDQEMETLGLDDAGAVTHAVLKRAPPGIDDAEAIDLARSMSARFRRPRASQGGANERMSFKGCGEPLSTHGARERSCGSRSSTQPTTGRTA